MKEGIKTRLELTSDGSGSVDVVLPGDDESTRYNLKDKRQLDKFVSETQLEWGVMVAMTNPDLEIAFWKDLAEAIRQKTGMISLPREAVELLRTRSYEKIEI